MVPTRAPAAAVDAYAQEDAAIQGAVARVAPSVVRIETVGGLERVGKLLIGEGPTTGLIVAPNGYILSSSFNFVQQPTSILVTLADGTRLPAKRIATDHNRKVTLLKVEASEELPVAEVAPLAEVSVGAWAIAVGRTFEGNEPNVSVGIVSALGRIWGKAIQTDAKISPANYGGPLIDIRGRVMGILVPLAPEQAADAAGVDWYDSGIGFAVSLEQLMTALPRLQQGEDLHPGVVGVSLKGKNIYVDSAELAIVRPNSPAYKAGLKPGDVIVEVDGQPIARQSQLKSQLNPRYAGDTVAVVVLRGEERLSRELELVDKLLPYDRPFLGVLPLRAPVADAEEKPAAEEGAATPAESAQQPLTIRYVYPNSPADKAGLRAGDRLVSLGGEPVTGLDDAANRVAASEVGAAIAIQVRRGDETIEAQATLAALPVDVPDELPPASAGLEAYAGERPAVGRSSLTVPEFKNECLLYVPENYDPRLPAGLVVWLHSAGGLKEDELLARWTKQCDERNLILAAPKAGNSGRWMPPELEFIRKATDQVRADYAIDPRRVVAAGHELGGQIAYVLAFANGDLIRGVAAIDAPLAGRVGETDPAQPLAVYTAKAGQGRTAAAIASGIERLRAAKFPVTVHDLGEAGRDLTPDELTALARWIDMLDRL